MSRFLLRKGHTAAAPVFDSAGGQAVNGTPSFAHTIGASANGLIVLWSQWATSSTTSETNLTVKVGTTPLTFLGRLWKFKQFSSFSTTYYASIYAFGLIDGDASTGSLALPKGAKTIACTGSGLNCVMSQSFSGVGSFDTANIQSGHTPSVTTGLTQAVTAPASSVVAQCFTSAASSPNGSYSAYSKTQEKNFAQSSSTQALAGGYGTGPDPVFGATAASTSWDNGFLAVPILGS